MFAARGILSASRRSPRQATLLINNLRTLNTTAPQLSSHGDGQADQDDLFYDGEAEEHHPIHELHRQPGFRLPTSWRRKAVPTNPTTQRTPRPNEAEYGVPLMSLRDMCTCPQCVDPSTRQKLFSTVEISPDIKITNVTRSVDSIEVEWGNDLPGFDESHKSIFPKEIFDAMAAYGSPKPLSPLPARRLWTDQQFRSESEDINFNAYMKDDSTLYKALQQLHTHGLLFLKDVPKSEHFVSRIVQRIGPLKNTFYGKTWDVRSVPEAKNVAYTSQDLGFHMDLLYMKQPPHLQFLHCIHSAAAGGANLFADSFKAVTEIYESDQDAFCELEKRPITFHYDHMDSHYYQQSRPLIELAPLRFNNNIFSNFEEFRNYKIRRGSASWVQGLFKLEDYLEAVTWSPPFQAPFQTTNPHLRRPEQHGLTQEMEINLRYWHRAARQFSDIIHKKENIHERMMKPGECVIFDNRRVLHARRAFEVADAGKERWLRGAYLDKDPFVSKLRVLAHRFEKEQGAVDSQADKQETPELAAQTA